MMTCQMLLLTRVLVATAICLNLLVGTGFCFNIEITPNQVNGLLHNDVDMNCRLDESDSEVMEVTILELLKGEEPVAVLREGSKISLGSDWEQKVEAEGELNAPTSASYIHVTLKNPGLVEAGQYTCKMFYLDASQIVQETMRVSNFSVSVEDLRYAVKYLVDMVSSLKDDLSDHRSQIQTLQSELQEQKTQSVLYKEQISTLSDNVTDLLYKDNTTVVFTALHTKVGLFINGQVMPFGHVLVNEGGAYNGFTGIFTAPVAGYYLFGLSVAPINGKLIVLDLRTNKGKILTRLTAGEAQWIDYADSSCVSRLEAGESVVPIIRLVHPAFALWSQDPIDYINKFYGYLVKAL